MVAWGVRRLNTTAAIAELQVLAALLGHRRRPRRKFEVLAARPPTPAVQRAPGPLAKPVQIARGFAAAARTAPITGSNGARVAA